MRYGIDNTKPEFDYKVGSYLLLKIGEELELRQIIKVEGKYAFLDVSGFVTTPLYSSINVLIEGFKTKITPLEQTQIAKFRKLV